MNEKAKSDRIQLNYISDTHLEGLFDKRGHLEKEILSRCYKPLFACNRQPGVGENILLIAGDFTESRKFHYFAHFLAEVVSENGYDAILYVPGNHEYYGDSLQHAADRIRRAAEEAGLGKVFRLVDNETASFDGGRVRIHGTVFWYGLLPGDEYILKWRLNDYRRIRCYEDGNYRRLQCADILSRHKEALNFLESALSAAGDGEDILFTHHPPSLRFGTAEPGYGTALPARWFLPDDGCGRKIKAAVHGHSHICRPYRYESEYGFPCHTHTVGYYGNEFKPDSEIGRELMRDGLPFLIV